MPSGLIADSGGESSSSGRPETSWPSGRASALSLPLCLLSRCLVFALELVPPQRIGSEISALLCMDGGKGEDLAPGELGWPPLCNYVVAGALNRADMGILSSHPVVCSF